MRTVPSGETVYLGKAKWRELCVMLFHSAVSSVSEPFFALQMEITKKNIAFRKKERSKGRSSTEGFRKNKRTQEMKEKILTHLSTK